MEWETSINISWTTYKRSIQQGKFWCFFFETFLKLHYKWEFKPCMHKSKAVFPQDSGNFFCFLNKGQGRTPDPSCTSVFKDYVFEKICFTLILITYTSFTTSVKWKVLVVLICWKILLTSCAEDPFYMWPEMKSCLMWKLVLFTWIIS